MDLHKYLSERGSGAALARQLGVPPELISQWRNGDRDVPLERVLEIVEATGGSVTCEELRPDIDWALLRKRVAITKAEAAHE